MGQNKINAGVVDRQSSRKKINSKERKPNQASTQVEASKWKSNFATPNQAEQNSVLKINQCHKRRHVERSPKLIQPRPDEPRQAKEGW